MFKKAVVISALFVFLAGQIAYAAAPELNIAGQVQGAGTAEMKTNTGWISVSGKTFPMANGSDLATGKDGGMTIMLKNGARIEVGKDSEVLVSDTSGNYSMVVRRGTVTWDVPQSALLTITTAQGKVTSGALTKGFLGAGKDTYVKSLAGDITVASEVDPMTLTPGMAVVVKMNGQISVINLTEDEIAQIVSENPAVATGGAVAGSTITSTSGSTATVLGIVGGAAAAGAVAAAISSHHGSSSPY